MQEYTAILEQIALHLGAPWKVNHLEADSCWQRQIIDGLGRGLIISKQYNNTRFRISGMFQRSTTRPNHGDHLSIGVSLSRPPKDIAADIGRRLLPDYLVAYERAKAKFVDEQAREQQLDHVAQSLMKVTGGRVGHQSGAGQRTIYFTHGEAQIYSYSGDVKLTLHSLTAELAIKIAASLVANGREVQS